MRKLTLVLIVVLLLISQASGHVISAQPFLLEGESGLEHYEAFLSALKSAEVTRTDISFDSWYKFVGFTSEEICFQREDSGTQKLTYRVREPFVFWSYPPPSYFDGKNYYYSYNGNWFVDTHNRFTSYLQRDFMGIPTYILETYPIISDQVFQLGDEYEILIMAQAPNESELYQIAATLDADKLFKQIQITVTTRHADGKSSYRHFYQIKYEKVNQPLTIKPPSDFDPATVIGSVNRK